MTAPTQATAAAAEDQTQDFDADTVARLCQATGMTEAQVKEAMSQAQAQVQSMVADPLEAMTRALFKDFANLTLSFNERVQELKEQGKTPTFEEISRFVDVEAKITTAFAKAKDTMRAEDEIEKKKAQQQAVAGMNSCDMRYAHTGLYL